ncbi:EAL domain-containing protein [Paenibacillus sp. MCAF9]|uniref:EAL domain-containing protein n=1 Tax=Paenibacillus sp. MCAF9 TaxID=3233046 RepID=UPI003F996B79
MKFLTYFGLGGATMSCQNCELVPPIQDQGTINLVTPQKSEQIQYTSKEQLLEYLNKLLQQLSPEEQSAVQIEFGKLGEARSTLTPYRLPLNLFAARIHHHHLVHMIADNHFTSFMQPIMDIVSQNIFAYEFLMRPVEGQPAFQPYELFQVAQQTGLHSFLDRSARISAIQVSAMHLKKGTKRFINFLPSSIYNPNYCLSHTFEAIEQYEQDPQDFVFEVVETEKISDVLHLKNIFNVYKEHGIQVALDDVGSGFSTLDVLEELKPHFVKIDRELVSHCDSNDKKQKLIADIVRSARSFGATVLAEGVERKEELDFCKTQQITLAQGYLIGKPAPLPLSNQPILI